jgi:hypothetical protein
MFVYGKRPAVNWISEKKMSFIAHFDPPKGFRDVQIRKRAFGK